MEKKKQIEIITNLCDSIRDDLINKIQANKVPENWDGFELRWWIEEKTKDEANYASRIYNGKSRRRKEYVNTIIVNNL